MAPVTDPAGRDRAQIVLIGALTLAVSLVAVAVVLNSAIYTENLASRSGDAGVGAAVDARESVRDGVGGLTDRVNENHAGDDYATLSGTHVPTALADWRPMAVRHQAVAGRTFRVTRAGGMEGTRIVDGDPASAFEPLESGADSLGYSDSSWMVTSRSKVRSFHINDVGSGDVPSADPNDPKGAATEVFYVEVREVLDDQSVQDSWRVAVYENAAGNVEVLVYAVGEGVVGTCSTTGSARIDLTGATLNGEHCRPLTFFEDLDQLTEIHYVNGGNIHGTYELTVDRAGHHTGDPLKDSVDTVNYGDQCSPGKTYSDATGTFPYASAAVYSVTVDYRYVSESVTYETEVRAARGEPGSGATHPVITDFTVSDASGTDATFDVSWTVADPNADLDSATVELRHGGTLVDSASAAGISGSSNSGSVTVSDSGGSGNTYEVIVTVTDNGGRARSGSESHQADGDESGCPP